MVKKWNVVIPKLSGEKPRRAYVWLPESYEESVEKHYPVMYMFDGHNVFFDEDATFGKSWGMGEYMHKSGKQLIIVAVECNHGLNKRLEEYSPIDFTFPDIQVNGRGKVYMDWMVSTLKPYIDENYPTLTEREHTSIAGSSMGGLMSLYGVCEYNHVFQKAACISPSFWVSKDRVVDLVAQSDLATDSRIYIDYGSLELPNHSTSSEALVSVARMLLTRRVNVTLKIIPGGIHNESSWEKQIPEFMDYLGL